VKRSFWGTRGRLFLTVLVGVAGATPAHAQEPSRPRTAQTQRLEHTVKRGDTLWDLANTYLNNPFLWPLIYDVNRNVVDNPHWIQPNQNLLIVIPPLPREKEAAVVVVAKQPTGERTSVTIRTRFYSPPATAATPTSIMMETPAPRRVEPGEFHASPWLADADHLPVRGSLLGPAAGNRESQHASTPFHPYERVYLRYHGETRPLVGELLLVVKVGRSIDGYGRIIQPTGVVRVDSMYTSTMLALVTHQFGRMERGDIVLPMDSFPGTSAAATPINDGPQGTIVGFLVRQPVYGTEELGFVSLGHASGVNVGDELQAQLPAGGAEDRLPAQPIARLVVTRVAQRSATVRVLSLQHPVLQPGLPVRLVARMQ
jgi:LysM domain-containing protein